MTASARTLSIEETLLEPPALPPPPTRHALLIILIALAALLHVVTVGTGDLYSETEGQYAGAAREMVASHNWLLPTNNGIPRLQKPPLLYWLIIASYKILGVNEAAARLPVALAVVATVALIFLIGEKLSHYWRGFIAGLIYLSFCGTFLLARIVMPEPLVTAFIAGAMFCGICGYERRRHRRMWFAGVWIFAALACLTKGVLGIVYPAVVFVLLSIFYREARIRFRGLLRWEYVLIFLLILAPWHIWAQWHFPHYFHYLVRSEWLGHLRGLTDETHDFLGVPAYQFVILHVAWWFPWSIALLPGIVNDLDRAVTTVPDGLAKTRIHGDYHLGQVLWDRNDFYIIDFEGEPGRALPERRAQQSPLKDVAGMVRSFSYASQAALAAWRARHPEDGAKLVAWARFWEANVSRIFVQGYRAAAAAAIFVPEGYDRFTALLRIFLIEKALYELRYELNNRPDWLHIPLAGLIELLDKGPSA